MSSSAERILRPLRLLFPALFLFTACADENPTPPRVHPGFWMVRSSEDFHGRRVTGYGVPFCESCHGEDLRGGPRATSCFACHALGGSCSGCHGRLMWDYAPPPDLSGNTDTDAIGVGAHLFHVNPSRFVDPYDCVECHRKPTEIESPGHVDDGLPAEVVFGDLAAADGADPEWNRSGPTCSGVYCHGATHVEPGVTGPIVWTTVDGTQVYCGSCHRIPPHEDRGRCDGCHGNVVSADTTITESGRTLHVNGEINF